MAATSKQHGFHIVEVLLAVGAVVLIGFIGWRVWDAMHPNQQASTEKTQSASQVPTISTPKDLDTVSKAVDEVNTDSSLSDLDSLENELNSLQ